MSSQFPDRAETVALSVTRATRASRAGAVFAMVLIVVLITGPWWLGRADMRLLVEIFYFLALAQMWNLLAGYGGLVSVGQQAFIGLGGYLLFILAIHFGIGALWTVPLAGLIGAVISLPIAFLVFRLRGHYFAIGTWVVAEVFSLGFAQVTSLGGGSGMSLPIATLQTVASTRAGRESAIYWLALAVAVAVTAGIYLLLHSRHGLALTAIRDSEEASHSLGVDNFRTKLMVYVIAAFGTSAIGALIYLTKLRITPSAAFDINWTTTVIFIVVIGGIGSIEGPIIGTIIFFLLREPLAHLGSWYLILLGITAVVIMLKSPQGVWGFVANRYGLRFFPVQRRVDFDDAPKNDSA